MGRRVCAVMVLVAAAVPAATSAAQAAASTSLLAGYTVQVGPTSQTSLLFGVPQADCSGAPDGALTMGVIEADAAGYDLVTLGLHVTCTAGAADYRVGFANGGPTRPFKESVAAAPGDTVHVFTCAALRGCSTHSFTVEDLNAGFRASVHHGADANATTRFYGATTGGTDVPAPSFSPVLMDVIAEGHSLDQQHPTRSQQRSVVGPYNVVTAGKINPKTYNFRLSSRHHL